MSDASAVDGTRLDSPATDTTRPEGQPAAVPASNPVPGVPWVIAIFVGAAVSYVVLRVLFNAF